MFSQVTTDEKGVQYAFFIKLANGAQDHLVRYGVMSAKNGYIIDYKYLTLEDWMWEITGRRPSKANPDSTDLLLKYGIPMNSIKDLWKIKYQEYPWRQKYEKDNKGWASQRVSPSKVQMNYLKKYGVKEFISEPIFGYNLFNLLKDMTDPTWVSDYMNL
jgi:hypothetical protein